ncbi:MAG: EAL domain-containing protein [Pseudomonas marincola]
MSSVQGFLPTQEELEEAPTKAEKLLRALSLMQACRQTNSFFQTTLSELSAVYETLSFCAFLTVSETDGSYKVVAKAGLTPKTLNPEQLALLKRSLQSGKTVFSGKSASLCLRHGDKRLGAIFLEAADEWSVSDFKLLEYFAVNAARGFETSLMLEEAEQVAFEDNLTQLGNRASFKKNIALQILNEGPEQKPFVAIQFILENLAELNIALGYSTGDELICRAADKLSEMFPDAISLARTSGDGFGVCIEVKNVSDAEALPHTINTVFNTYLPETFNLPHLTPRIGLTLFPKDGDTGDRLWKNTSTALANARKLGGQNFCFYDNQIEIEIHGRVTLNRALREGMSQKQLSLNYQPQICLESGKMVGVEALLRWQREDGKFVPADTFIPIAEASGLLGPISEWVVREACLQRMRWTVGGVPEFPVAVNISLNEFQSEDFVPLVRQILDETGLPASLLDIELTESVIMEDRGQTKRNMLRLKKLGVRLSIDDFGTGYSSLSYLSDLPASVLKIDKSFVDGVTLNNNDAAIAKTIIALGYNLGMRVLAEGVENKEQILFLRDAGCHEAQGFTFSKAVTADQIPALASHPNFLEGLI